jgi:hypothetical protein
VDASSFELTVSLQDERFVSAVRALVDTAAKYAGCPSAPAAQFAGEVADAVNASLQQPRSGSDPLPVTLRRADGPLEVEVSGRVFRLEL